MTTKAKNIVITGICGTLGKLLTKKLHGKYNIIGIDRRNFPEKPKDIIHIQTEISRKNVREIFRNKDIDIVVHLGILHNPSSSLAEHTVWNIEGFGKLLSYCYDYDVKKLILLSSGSTYGVRPTNPQIITEDAPLMATLHGDFFADHVQIDMMAQSFFLKHPEIKTIILRPCPIAGEVKNAILYYLIKKNPLTLMGFDPLIQILSADEVVEAIELAIQKDVQGIFNLASNNAVPISLILKLLSKKTISVPYTLASIALKILWITKLSKFPPGELEFLHYNCLLDDSKARAELMWKPHNEIEQIIKILKLDIEGMLMHNVNYRGS